MVDLLTSDYSVFTTVMNAAARMPPRIQEPKAINKAARARVGGLIQGIMQDALIGTRASAVIGSSSVTIYSSAETVPQIVATQMPPAAMETKQWNRKEVQLIIHSTLANSILPRPFKSFWHFSDLGTFLFHLSTRKCAFASWTQFQPPTHPSRSTVDLNSGLFSLTPLSPSHSDAA